MESMSAEHRRGALVALSAVASGGGEDVLEEAARLVAEGLDVGFTKIMEVLPDGDLLIRAGHGWPPGVVEHARDKRDAGSQAGYTIMSGVPIVIEDLPRETRFAVPEAVTANGVTSSITVLIPGKRAPYGVLQADSKKRRTFTHAELEFLLIAANTIGGTVLRMRAERAQRLQQSVAMALNVATSVREGALDLLEPMCQELGFTAGGFWRHHVEADALELSSCWPHESYGLAYPGMGQHRRRGEGRVGQVWETGQVYWAADIAQDTLCFRQEALRENGWSAGIYLPIVAHGRVFGVVELFKSDPYEPDADMLALLEALAGQVGVFIERIRAEQQARRRERDFRALVENNPDFIARYDRDLRCTYANPALLQAAGLILEEVQGKTPGEEPFGVAQEVWDRALLPVFESGQEQSVEMEYVWGDRRFVLNCRAVPEFDDRREVESVLLISRDVTAMKQAEEEAQSHYEEVRALVEAAPAGILIADAKSRKVILANSEYERLVDRPRRPGDPVAPEKRRIKARRLDGSEIQMHEIPVARALNGEVGITEELIYEHEDGSVYNVVTTSAPVFDANGDVRAVVVVLQDITRLRQLDRLRSDFLGMVGHELRTPLAIIRLAAGSLVVGIDKVSRDEIAETLATVDQQAARMTVMISNLRDMAQIEAGAFAAHAAPGDLREVVEQARDEMRALGIKNIELEVHSQVPPVLMDRTRVLQVLENLLNNAESYGIDGEPIRIAVIMGEAGVDTVPPAVTVRVTNAGGLSKERQALLFQKFSRLGRSRSESGSGLGLVISKGIVEALGGRIWVESDEESDFTTFAFSLPLAEEPAAPRSRRPRRSARRTRPRVLAVDDEPQILRHLKQVLDRSGFQTTTLSDPAKVDAELAKERPDLILLDVIFPGGTSGFDICERIKNSGIPIVFLSGSAEDADRQRAMDMGAAAYLVKPVPTADLVAAAEAAVGGRERQRQ
ncbi:MAG: GAF domain-containing protein [Dehalococcoidia bacterium]